MTTLISRRELLRASTLVGGGFWIGLQAASQSELEEPFRHGRKVSTVDFSEEAPVLLGQAFGRELDRRLYTDLARLTPKNITTPTNEFYIRTGVSQLLPEANLTSIKVSGLTRQPFQLTVANLLRRATSKGIHLMECAGNARAVHFGMMSVADWAGVAISEVVADAKVLPNATRVLISGFDQYANPSSTSVPGASWVFTLPELTGAFLATRMNGQPLTADHGAPIRLVVPNWYGCACIKWVNEILFVNNDAPATSQMQEYATRTLQNGVPQLAREYEPATVDQAAMPIRIEKWSVGGKMLYRVIGILWGGSQPVRALEIRFNPEENYVPVDQLESPSNDSWGFWSHAWKPPRPGSYMIRLRVKEPRVRARKLDAGYYMRTVEIREV